MSSHPHPCCRHTAPCTRMSLVAKREEAAPRLLLLGDAVRNWCPQGLNRKGVHWCLNALGHCSHAHERRRALQQRLAQVWGWKGWRETAPELPQHRPPPEPLQALVLLAGGATHLRPGENSPLGGVRLVTGRLPNWMIRDLFMHSLILLHRLCGCRSLPAPLYPPLEQDKTCA